MSVETGGVESHLKGVFLMLITDIILYVYEIHKDFVVNEGKLLSVKPKCSCYCKSMTSRNGPGNVLRSLLLSSPPCNGCALSPSLTPRVPHFLDVFRNVKFLLTISTSYSKFRSYLIYVMQKKNFFFYIYILFWVRET